MSVPALRFPEFERKWEEIRLGSLAVSISSGKSSHVSEGEIPVYGSTGRIGSTTQADYSGPAILVARVGANAGVLNQVLGEYGVTDNTLIVPVKEDADQDFVFAQLTKTNLNRYVFGSGQPLITGTMLKRLKGYYPALPEQKKIATFLGVVDEKLAALRARRAGLETYKRGLMQKLFSRTLRFTKPDGSAFPDWEEKRLGDLLTVKYGKDHKDLPDGEFPVIGTGGVMRHVDRYLYDRPSVLIGRKGTIDKPSFVTSPFWTVDTLFYSEIHQDVVPYFAFLVVQSINWLKYNEATGVPSLSATAIHGVKVTVPTDPGEEAVIADALQAMEAKVVAVADQITRVEAFKKGLLQQMFV